MTRKGNLRQSDRDAINRYHEKTYKRYSIVFRVEDDKDIIGEMERAHEQGLSGRSLIRSWYDAYTRSGSHKMQK